MSSVDKYGRPLAERLDRPSVQQDDRNSEGAPAPSQKTVLELAMNIVTTETEQRLREATYRRGRNLRRAGPKVWGATKKDVDGDETFVNGVRKAWSDEKKAMSGQPIYTRPNGDVVLRGAGHKSRQAPDEDTLLRQVQAMERELARLNEMVMKMTQEKESAE